MTVETRLRLSILPVALALLAAGASAHDEPIAVYSAASLDSDRPVAPRSIAIVEGDFGDRLAMAPNGVPTVELDSVRVRISGSDGVEQDAAIFAVNPQHVRILVPSLPAGTAHIEVRRAAEVIADGTFRVQSVSPGLFSAAGSGGGFADAMAVRVNMATGARSVEAVAYLNDRTGAYEPVPLNPAADDVVLFLKLRGTGIRNASKVSVTIAGVSVPANCRHPGDAPAGIDEVSVGPLPVQLAHREVAEVVLTADEITSNAVRVAFSPSTGEAITFSNQISRLFQEHCQECHRPGEVAPFPLIEYQDAMSRATSIVSAAESRSMPPWKPVPGHGKFLNERRLSEEEIKLLRLWVDAGAPEGNPADLPAPREFSNDWSLGEPDVILEAPTYSPDPNANDDYRCFSVQLPESITESKSITKIEVQPGNRRIVHHVILYGDPIGESAALQASTSDGKPGYRCFGSGGISLSGFTLGVESYLMGGWAPGTRPMVLPEDTGLYVRRGARFALQVHYHPDGKPESDSTRIGLHFADRRTSQNASVIPVINTRFVIPPGEPRHEVTASLDLEGFAGDLVPAAFLPAIEASGIFPVDIINVLPHMHKLGQEIRMDKISSDGTRTPMVYIDDWDFNWQDFYYYVEPVKFNIGDRLEVSAIYDNSTSNPNNPNNPPRSVGWGNGSDDEMCIVFFTVVLPDLCRFPLGLCNSH